MRRPRAGLIAIPGVEVSSWWEGSIFHVLCLKVDVASATLQELLTEILGESQAVAARAAAVLRGRGFPLEGLEAAREGSALPVDILATALRAGLAPTYPEVVEYLVEGMGLSFAAGAPMGRVVEACHAAGGIAILAHPGRAEYGFTTAAPSAVAAMARATGLDGLEVYHWSHGPVEEAVYGRLAADEGLLVSCGSDSHGPRSQHPLGGREARVCRALLARCGIEVVGA